MGIIEKTLPICGSLYIYIFNVYPSRRGDLFFQRFLQHKSFSLLHKNIAKGSLWKLHFLIFILQIPFRCYLCERELDIIKCCSQVPYVSKLDKKPTHLHDLNVLLILILSPCHQHKANLQLMTLNSLFPINKMFFHVTVKRLSLCHGHTNWLNASHSQNNIYHCSQNNMTVAVYQ